MNKIVIYLAIFCVACFSAACDSIVKEAEIPAYVQIDSVIVNVEEGQGTDHHKITDVWVNLDGNRVGTFSLPAKFPIIAKGQHTLQIWAGVLKNGISDFRERYVFFEFDEQKLDLKPNEVCKITPQIKYYDETKVDFWIEDFEAPGMKFHTTDSVNLLQQIQLDDATSNKVGYINMPDTAKFFDFFTEEEIPFNSRSIYMELEYKSTVTFAIGVKVKEVDGGYRYDDPFTYVYPKKDWNKLYINLNEQFNLSSSHAKAFDVYFAVPRNTNIEKSEVFLDNIKILSFK